MKIRLFSSALMIICFAAGTRLAAQTSITFSNPDTVDYWTVPAGIDSIKVDLLGASGCAYVNSGTLSYIYGYPGNGGEVQATLAVTPGQVLKLTIGGPGRLGGAAAYNGGGGGSSDVYGHSGGGGGATDIRIGGAALTNRVVVAGGGGGTACDYPNYSVDYGGGDAGHPAGGMGRSNGTTGPGGGGGTLLAGGYAGTHGTDVAGTAGGLGYGGSAASPGGSSIAGGGGGGGYYGGGAGTYGGGGGGSSYADPAIARNVTYTSYFGTPYVTITWGFKPSLSVPFAGNSIQMAGIAPNPSTTYAQLDVILGASADLNISVTDMTGRLVWLDVSQREIGRVTIPLPASSLQPGIYMVHVSAGNGQYDKVLKWVKQ